MQKINSLLIPLFAAIILEGCSFSELTGDKNLGKGYYFFSHRSFSSIVLSSTDSYQGNGPRVVPSEVVSHSFNDEYIIALSRDINTKEKTYWIINKNMPARIKSLVEENGSQHIIWTNVSGPLDSLEFSKMLEQKLINLQL